MSSTAQTKQAKNHSSNPATKAAEPSQKAVHGAMAPTRLPAWTRAWGDHPPVELFPDSELTIQRQVSPLDNPNLDDKQHRSNGNQSLDQIDLSPQHNTNTDTSSDQAK